MTTINKFIAQQQITWSVEYADRNPNMDGSENMDNWRVCLRRPGGKRMTVYFSKGVGHNGTEPNAAEVLDCLASDCNGMDNRRSFKDWCADYGYDTDSRKAHRTFKVCERQAERLFKFLGETAYTELVAGNVERL